MIARIPSKTGQTRPDFDGLTVRIPLALTLFMCFVGILTVLPVVVAFNRKTVDSGVIFEMTTFWIVVSAESLENAPLMELSSVGV